jgi:hypothetical protein
MGVGGPGRGRFVRAMSRGGRHRSAGRAGGPPISPRALFWARRSGAFPVLRPRIQPQPRVVDSMQLHYGWGRTAPGGSRPARAEGKGWANKTNKAGPSERLTARAERGGDAGWPPAQHISLVCFPPTCPMSSLVRVHGGGSARPRSACVCASARATLRAHAAPRQLRRRLPHADSPIPTSSPPPPLFFFFLSILFYRRRTFATNST